MDLITENIFTNFEEALNNPEAVKALHLIKQKGVKKLLKRIGELINLEEVKIDSCTMSAIPKELWDATNLKSLTILNCGHRLREYPEEIGNLVNLEYLCLGKQSIETLPDSIGNLTQLKTFRMQDMFVESLPQSMSNFQNLSHFELVHTRLKKLPIWLKDLTQLEYLKMDGIRIRSEVKPFPDDFFLGFKQLKTLILTDCDMTYSSESIAKLTDLEELNLSGNSFIKFPIELLKLKKLGKKFYLSGNKHYAYGRPTNLTGANDVKLTVEKYNISYEEAECYYGCLGRYKVDSMSSATLMGALTQNGLPSMVRINAVDFVSRLYDGNQTTVKLQGGHKLAILGDYKMSKKDAKICADYDVELLGQITDDIPKDCTHILVGENTPTDKRLDAGSCQLMAPQNFAEWVNSEKELYLLDESSEDAPQMQENVLELLDSANTDNIKVALSLMEGGGVPKEAITLLFIMAKMDHVDAIKKKAKKLLTPLLSSKAKENLKIRGSFKTTNDVPDLVDKLLAGIDREIDRYIIYKYYYTRFSADRYMEPYLLNAPEADQRKVVWDKVIDGNVLTLWETWAFAGGSCRADADLPDLQHIEEVVLKGKEVTTMTGNYLSKLKNVHTIRLINTRVSFGFSFDAERDLGKFENLRTLEISLNSSFKYLKNLFASTYLEELCLPEMTIYGHTNELTAIPEEIRQMTNLKVLKINHQHSMFDNLEILAELPNLEHLSLATCPIENVPLDWKALTNLKTLDLTGTGIKKVPKELQEHLVECTIHL